MIRLGRAWNRYHKENPFLLGGFLFLLALLAGAFFLVQRTQAASPEELTNRLLLFVLWYLDISLILIISFILARNLVKLILERRAGILGARFRTKLVLTYVALTFVPVIFIFLIATNLLQHSIDRWFSAPVEEILSGGRVLAVQLREVMEDRLREQVKIAAQELAADPSPSRIAHLQRTMGVDLVTLFEGDDLVETVTNARRIPETVPPLRWNKLEERGVRVERWQGGLLVRAWTPLGAGSGRVVVGAVLPRNLRLHLDRAITADSEYQSMKQQQGTVTATTILVFLSVTLLLLFTTVWVGLYLSRRFTEPLLVVTAATRRIAAGDALEEVMVPASDEVGILVDSFNAMVRRVRATKEEILSSNQELEALLATIPTGILALSPDCSRFRSNAAAARMLGNESWCNTWQSLASLAQPGLEGLYDRLQSQKTESTHFDVELTVNSETRHLEITRRPFPGGGVVIAMDDLTELLLAQRQAAWSEVAQRIAHEIKNPLTPILLAAERIQRRAEVIDGEVGQILSTSCEAIIAHVSGLQALVDAFHQYAQMPVVKPRPLRLDHLLREATSLYEDLREGLEIVAHSPEKPLWAMVDPVLLRQALVNLIDNAAAAIEENGRVEVRAERRGDDIVIEVVDDGAGLATDDIRLLTRPFFSTKGRGSGMGLAIVDRIVRDHEGALDLMSRASGGTLARIVLTRAAITDPAETPVGGEQ
ncbi:MAG: HAMP domain-containing protein [Thermoanaerobaculales bacterium]|nr:HAMP domain-containing protein [Thermoanaerobaculales bacterium]